jgi:hypothetical protein
MALAIRTQGVGAPRVRAWNRVRIMMRKLFATSCLAGMVIIGATALVSAAPNPSESGPSSSDSPTTPTTTTTSATNAPYPGHMGY